MDFGSIKGSRRSFLLGSTMAVLTVATPLGLSRAVAQDAVAIQTRVQVLHAATSLDKVEVHFNGEQSLDKFAYGDQSDWIDVDPGSV